MSTEGMPDRIWAGHWGHGHWWWDDGPEEDTVEYISLTEHKRLLAEAVEQAVRDEQEYFHNSTGL